MLILVVFYSFTWIVGGLGLWFMLRAVGADPGILSIIFLGGVSAVGAIVAVLSFFAPSGLGPREASMYGLMLGVAGEGAALGATVLNRVAITLVEVMLLVVGGLLLRGRHPKGGPRARRRARVRGSSAAFCAARRASRRRAPIGRSPARSGRTCGAVRRRPHVTIVRS